MSVALRAPSLLAALIRAHAVLSSDVDSLALMLRGAASDNGGGVGPAAGSSGLVALARHHLTSCLKCWVEAAEPWQPELLPQILVGGRVPGLAAGAVPARVSVAEWRGSKAVAL